MRGRLAVLAGALALVTAPEARGDHYVERWLGVWRGTATWSGCTAEGATELEVPVRWHDDMLWVDASGVYETLGEIAPEVRAGDVLALETDDLSLALAPPRPAKGKRGKKARAPAAAVLTFSTAAQCTMTARLVRDSTGVAACDGLAALEEVARGCTADPTEAAEDDAVPTTAAACTTRAADLRDRLGAAGCLPSEQDLSDTPECRVVWTLAQRIARCTRAPADFQRSIGEHVAELRRALRRFASADHGAELVAAHCDESAEMLRDVADDVLHCP